MFNQNSTNYKIALSYSEKVHNLRNDIIHKGIRKVDFKIAENAERLSAGCLLKIFENVNYFNTNKEYVHWLNNK